MRASRLWGVLILALGASSLFLAFTNTNRSYRSQGSSNYVTEVILSTKNRKLKEDLSMISMEDYHPIDPVPTSKATVKSGPIEHGTPLIPYIPQPAPPRGQPTHPGPP
ncbi:uncharacterized protein LOC116249979 isoform X2 [Nymphaea colorata]|uniref:uncharacterized protein LOC116249979 isoform X2 n=1 Tax=Nymphaea colorata TaxID=210225 RepID=UPI00129E9BA9|nr:uncharacterized protein LOC116249979 isoform X2 [Nymphaea colorata]